MQGRKASGLNTALSYICAQWRKNARRGGAYIQERFLDDLPGSTSRRPGSPSWCPALRAKAKARDTSLGMTVQNAGRKASGLNTALSYIFFGAVVSCERDC